MRWLPLAMALCLVVALWPSAVLAQAPCSFVLGFAELRDMLGADIVGDCLEDQRQVPGGDARQRTTIGELIWRAADGATLFTNGATTWVLGPFGLQMRASEQRFDWEAVSVAPAPAPLPEPAPVRPAPAPRVSPEVASRCYRMATDVITEILPRARAGSGNPAGAIDELNTMCQGAALKDGARGVDCMEWSFRRFIALAPSLSPGTDPYAVVGTFYLGCVGR